ncbi:hypothetical protein Goari_025443 [Gossypium aridum]|uniref:Uncharacterized protein n=1 Tax=Gossypium aridum TaxID=34290 RepID=A0A7J8X961_GOSAI|nr:hypothetical protein [Gossypium aridum]
MATMTSTGEENRAETHTTNDRIDENRLLGKGQLDLKKTEGIDPECDVDFEFCEGDISKSTINGIPLIEFSERVHQFLNQDMSITVVLKLLERNIGYVAFFNRIHSLWRPSVSIQLMDIEVIFSQSSQTKGISTR